MNEILCKFFCLATQPESTTSITFYWPMKYRMCLPWDFYGLRVLARKSMWPSNASLFARSTCGNFRFRLARANQDHQHGEIGHIRALGIGLDLACNGGPTLGI